MWIKEDDAMITRQSKRKLKLIAAFSVVVLLNGCGTTSKVKGDIATTQKGLTYYLTHDRVRIHGTATLRKMVEVKDDLTIDDSSVFKLQSVDLTVAYENVVEPERVFLIDLPPNGYTADNFTVTTSRTGVLSSLSATSTGHAGEVIQNATNIVANIAPFVGLLGGGVPAAQYDGTELKKAVDTLAPDDAFRSMAKQRFLVLSNTERHYLKHNQYGAENWAKRLVVVRKVSELRLKYSELMGTVAGKRDHEERKKGFQHIDAIDKALTHFEAESRRLSGVYDAGLVQHIRNEKLGAVDLVQKINTTLELEDLATPKIIHAGLDETEVGKALKEASLKKAFSLWDLTGIVVTAESFDSATEVIGKVKAEKSKSDVTIYYRRPQQIEIRVLQLKKSATAGNKVDQQLLALVNAELKDLIFRDAELVSVSFKRSLFAQHNMAVTFGPGGVPTTLARTSTSAADVATSKTSAALTTGLTTLQNSLKAKQQIGNLQRSIALDKIKDDINRLKQEKELVDARVALEATTASEGLLREQKELAAQLNAKKAEFDLVNLNAAQSVKVLEGELSLLTAKLDLDGAAAVQSMTLEQKRLAAELAALRSQIELDKIKATQKNAVTLEEIQQQVNLLAQQINLLKLQAQMEDLQD